jgi:hypothetical protein
MRTLPIVTATIIGLVAGAELDGQKKKTAPVPVTVSFENALIDHDGDPETRPVPTAVSGDFAGQVDVALTTTAAPLCIDLTAFAGADATYAPLSGCVVGGPAVHSYAGIPDGDSARQANITWSDPARSGWEYRLQYGDASTQPLPPNYVHLLCGSRTGSVCNAIVDTLGGTFPGGESTARVTGPAARLTVRTGGGRHGIKDLGVHSVPFVMTVTAGSPN